MNLIKSHAWYHISLITFPNKDLPCNKKTILNLVPKKCNFTHFLYHLVAPYGYIIVNYGIISFNFNCIMELKQFYNIATKVSGRKKVLLLLVIYLTDNRLHDNGLYNLCNVLLGAVLSRGWLRNDGIKINHAWRTTIPYYYKRNRLYNISQSSVFNYCDVYDMYDYHTVLFKHAL